MKGRATPTSGTVAIVGAGMAGAACARTLADAGVPVRLFDKGRAVGGRMAQRRVAAGVFDHGAQYLSAREPEFLTEVRRWREQGVAAEWTGVASSAGSPVLVGVPAMNAPVKELLDGLRVSAGFRVSELSYAAGDWTVRGEDGKSEGPFAAVVLAVPAPQALALLATVGQQRATGLIVRLGGVQMAPCWSALAAFAAPVETPEQVLRPSGGVVAWVARNASKPGRDEREAWTIHAAPGWSAEHLEREPGEVAPELLAAFASAAGGSLPELTFVDGHRWRYAMVERALGEPCLWDPALRLGLCGDWCLGPRVEAAYLSGRALARALANTGSAL